MHFSIENVERWKHRSKMAICALVLVLILWVGAGLAFWPVAEVFRVLFWIVYAVYVGILIVSMYVSREYGAASQLWSAASWISWMAIRPSDPKQYTYSDGVRIWLAVHPAYCGQAKVLTTGGEEVPDNSGLSDENAPVQIYLQTYGEAHERLLTISKSPDTGTIYVEGLEGVRRRVMFLGRLAQALNAPNGPSGLADLI